MTIVIDKIDSLIEAVNYFEMINNILAVEEMTIDFSEASFLRNHYLSIIGMGLRLLEEKSIEIKIIEPKETKVLNAMIRINFLQNFKTTIKVVNDTDKTIIRYTNIPLKDNAELLKDFYTYFLGQIQGKVDNLSPKLLNKILQKIFELFSNVFRHSESKLGLFCSGQFYPASHKFNFIIVDNGVTIKHNVNKYLKKKFKTRMFKSFREKDAIESITWALEDKNSTTGEGGLGLNLLLEFLELSKGTIEIISNNGYYSKKNRVTSQNILKNVFEGTVISIQLNTNPDNYYFLKEER